MTTPSDRDTFNAEVSHAALVEQLLTLVEHVTMLDDRLTREVEALTAQLDHLDGLLEQKVASLTAYIDGLSDTHSRRRALAVQTLERSLAALNDDLRRLSDRR